MSSAFPSFTQPVGHIRDRHAAPGHSLFSRVWRILLQAGQRRAADEIARQLRILDGRPTGNLELDIRQLAALRGLR